ncbi:MAG TPA: hypothetical protein VJ372_00190, partial [Pyrinomonadaceae bacterium]|nr:hypothetical protein [Pyrinomonadaceae bacterium]
MKTPRGSDINFYFLLAITVCAVLSPGKALAQNEAAPKVMSTSNLTVPASPNSSTAATSNSRESADIELLKAQLALQQKHIEQLERALEEQKKVLEQVLHLSIAGNASTAANGDAQSAGLDPSVTQPAPDAIKQPVTSAKSEDEAAPLALKLGKVYLSPVGFLDFTAFVRDRNVGSGLGTNFGSIPFSNTTSGQLSEYRSTMQNSRLGLRLDTRLRGTDVLGYVETDFNGFSPTNVAVTTNSNNLRVRLFWLDVRKHKWELLAGQSWSLLTPNRQGL